MSTYASWVEEGVASMQAALSAYMDRPSRATADAFIAAVRAAMDVHYARIGNRIRSDNLFAERVRLYGADLRAPAVRFATLALDAAREEEDAPGMEALTEWMRDDLLPATSETALLEREVNPNPAQEGTRAGSSGGGADPASDAPLPDAPPGWLRLDDSRAYGERWREAIHWPPEGTPGWDMLKGNYALFVRLDGASDVFDGLAGPVFLATGLRALPTGRAVLDAVVKGDVDCAQGKVAEPSLCRTSTVIDSLADPICNHYDGRGSVFLAECDCLKQLQLPSVMRLRTLCDDAARDPTSGINNQNCNDMAPDDKDRELRTWPAKDMTKIRSPILSNTVMRYAVRSQRRLSHMQGTFAACTYSPCASINSVAAYTDARTTALELARCPLMRCEASINVDWVGGNVTIDGNMLKVRCSGGACMQPDGLPRCKNGGRCQPDGKCNCEGTGFVGDTCETSLTAPAPTDPATPPPPPPTPPPPPPPAPEIAGPLEKPRSMFELSHLFNDVTLILTGLAIAGLIVAAFLVLRRVVNLGRREPELE
jgi:hypothetical protein